MDVKEAIARLKHETETDFNKWTIALDMAIEALERTRWIPVSERLPEVDTVVIGYDILWSEVCPVIHQDKFYNQVWHKIRGGKDLHQDRITHGMPMPKAPEVE